MRSRPYAGYVIVGSATGVKYRVDHRPLREVVASQLLAMIIDGELAQGSRLVEGQLAERLGVSRNPIREAIRSLEVTGLVDVVPRKGAYVCSVVRDDVRQMQELRMLIEGYAAEQAAKNRSEEQLAHLRECLECGRAATEAGDLEAEATWHRDFHLTIGEASANPFVSDALKPLRHRSELVFTLMADERRKISWAEHDRALRSDCRGIANSVERTDA